ncbi:MAG: radical SAM protein [Rikenellaceae bacterium]
MTALFSQVIFGPVRSRRLGLSLGVNLLPTHSKLCNFDCIYCECGWNEERRGSGKFNSKEEVTSALEAKLREMALAGELPDVITFAGNGEPTLHPDFEEIIASTIALRDALAPSAKVSVLSNATRIGLESVRRALKRVDHNILKLDAATTAMAKTINHPQGAYSMEQVVENMISFEGDLIVQSMFLRGECEGDIIDNTTVEAVEGWLALIKKIAPKSVMVYSIDRDTPCQTLEKVQREELLTIAEKVRALGIECSVA